MTILDISFDQGPISAPAFAAMKAAGITRVIHKAGGSNVGHEYTDSQYFGNVGRARSVGCLIGHYWFNGAIDPVSDANYFVDHLTGHQAEDWLILDVENENYPHWNPVQVLAFAKQVYARTGVKIIVYMSSSVTREQDWSAVVAFGCGLWVADYTGRIPTIAHWTSWVAWQFTSSGLVPGFGGHVDLSHEGASITQAATTITKFTPPPVEGSNMAVTALFHQVNSKPNAQGVHDQAFLALGAFGMQDIDHDYLVALSLAYRLPVVQINEYVRNALDVTSAEDLGKLVAALKSSGTSGPITIDSAAIAAALKIPTEFTITGKAVA